MNLLYNAGIGLFGLGLRVASLRSPKVRLMLDGQRDTLATLAETRRRVAPQGFDVWIHAASLGEFEQGRPLIERLRRERPDKKILLTFFSPSGYTVRHNFDKVDAVCYLPLDSRSRVREFLDAAAPRMAIFVKYEFWGNYLAELRRRGIATYIISAIFRKSQHFFRPGGGLFRRVLRCFDRLYVQDENSRRLLASIGIDNVTVAGDTRFDRVSDIMATARPLPKAVGELGRRYRTMLVVGSSWPADEDMYVDWLRRRRDVAAVAAPHEFDERRLARLLERLGTEACLLSQLTDAAQLPENCRIIVADCFGLLSSLYRVADVAYVGGGFGAGIHNINEAAVYGCPVVFGPNNSKFREAAELKSCGGGFQIVDRPSAEAVLDRLVDDGDARRTAAAAAGHYIARNLGATDLIYKDLFT